MKKFVLLIMSIIFSITLISCDVDDNTTQRDINYNNVYIPDKETVTTKVIDVTSVAIDSSNLSLVVNDSIDLNAAIYPNNATNKTLTWSSSNTSVATVSSSGYVFAKSPGTTTITVKSSNFKTDSILITVISDKLTVNISSYNVQQYFNIQVSEGSSYGSTYKFDVDIYRKTGVEIEAHTSITVKVEMEITYRTSGSYLTQKKTFSDSTTVIFYEGTYSSSSSSTASIYISSYSLPSDATDIEAYFSYKVSFASGKISY